MTTVRELHDKAMELTDQALTARRAGDTTSALQFFHDAFMLEEQAAFEFMEIAQSELTRAVLLRSAATLAFDCLDIDGAKRLITLAFEGNPPPEIAEELLDLFARIQQFIAIDKDIQ